MASRKKAKNSKGRRYTTEEKAAIIDHVEKINASKGRGGQTAAAKKFGISMLTISNWMKKSAPAAAGKSSVKSKGKGSSKSMNGSLAKLAALHSQIQSKEKELAKLKQQFNVIKSSL